VLHWRVADDLASRFPFTSLPSGWYAVAYSHELKSGRALARHYFGRDFILFRTDRGEVHATSAYCPHLGAHLGDARVEGDELRCAFHGFRFNGEGHCVGTAYGSKAPPKARLDTFEAREMNGVVLVWHDALGRAPEWEVPKLDLAGWTPVRGVRLELDSHPQETSENSVDFGHFAEVHGFQSPTVTEEAVAEGPVLRAAYAAVKQVGLPGLPKFGVEARFRVFVHGLGYSVVHGSAPKVGLHFRHLVLSTPVDAGRIHLRIATTTKRVMPGPVDWLLQGVSLGALYHEVMRDVPIWEHKRYVSKPALAKGDGPIPLYRRWAKQFYVEPPSLAAE